MTDKHPRFFSKVMATKSSAELEVIVVDEENYTEDARLAAIAELNERGNEDSSNIQIENEILKKQEQREVKHKEFVATQQPKLNRPDIVKYANYVLLITLFIGVAITAYNLFYYGLVTGIGRRVSYSGWIFYIPFVGVVIALFSLTHSVSIGKNRARIILLILLVVKSPYVIFEVSDLFSYNGILALLILMNSLIFTIALSLLFTPKSNKWYYFKKKETDLLDN
jgi:hypothetical protein